MKNLLSILKKVFLRTKIESIEPVCETVKLSDEEMKQIGEDLRKCGQLTRWMQHNSDDIFEVAPKNALYAVGIYRYPPTKPEIHYFNSMYTKKSVLDILRRNKPQGTLDFMKQLAEAGEVNTALIYKYEKDTEMMLACG